MMLEVGLRPGFVRLYLLFYTILLYDYIDRLPKGKLYNLAVPETLVSGNS